MIFLLKAEFFHYGHLGIFGNVARVANVWVEEGENATTKALELFQLVQTLEAKLNPFLPYWGGGIGIEGGWRFQIGRLFLDPVASFESQFSQEKIGNDGKVVLARTVSGSLIVKVGAQVHKKISIYGLLGGASTLTGGPLKEITSDQLKNKYFFICNHFYGFVYGGGVSFALTSRLSLSY